MDADGCTPDAYGAVTVLRPPNGGYYPYGHSLVVTGTGGTLLVDPSLALAGTRPPGVDAVVVSHAHEDHLVGLGRFGLPVHVHEADLAAVRSAETLLAGYGLPSAQAEAFRSSLHDDFLIESRPDARGVSDGHVFDLGDRTVTVVHLPGHTAGHSGLLVEPDGFLFVGDIDLSSFGPFYGDVGSSLEDFEASIRTVGEIEARWYGTYHQKGVIDGAAAFRERLAAYLGVVAARDAALTEFLREPRTLADVVEHRFVYRAHVDEPYVATVERRTAEQHIARLVREGRVAEVEPGLYRVVAA